MKLVDFTGFSNVDGLGIAMNSSKAAYKSELLMENLRTLPGLTPQEATSDDIIVQLYLAVVFLAHHLHDNYECWRSGLDCGIYAIAYATELAFGHDPCAATWETRPGCGALLGSGAGRTHQRWHPPPHIDLTSPERSLPWEVVCHVLRMASMCW